MACIRIMCIWVVLLGLVVAGSSGVSEDVQKARDRREWVSDALAEYIRNNFGVPDECPRWKTLPNDREWYAIKKKGLPVVFENGWNVFGTEVAKWRNLTYLLQRHGDTQLGGSYCDANDPKDLCGNTPTEDGQYLRLPHKRHTTMNAIASHSDKDRILFAEQNALFDAEQEFASPMAADWEAPSFIPEIALQSVSIWMGKVNLPGKRPKVSSTHYDPVDNLFLQLHGRKKFWLYHANFLAAIYPRYMRHKFAVDPDAGGGEQTGDSIQDNFSPLDPRKPDLDKFPRAVNAQPTMCSLKPGDVLFMPSFTWHNVESYGEPDVDPKADHLVMGLNTWMEGDERYQLLFEAVMHLLQGAEMGMLPGIRDDTILAESESGRRVEL